MKKQLRLLLALTLTFTMLFSLVGCAGAGSGASENEVVINAASDETNGSGNAGSSDAIRNYATPSPELSNDISTRNIQIGNKVLTPPFQLSDMADIHDDVIGIFTEFDEGPDFNLSDGSILNSDDTLYMEPQSVEAFEICIYANRGDNPQYQRLHVQLVNTSDERIPVSEGKVEWLCTEDLDYWEHVVVDVILPGGISAYKTYPAETYYDAWGSVVDSISSYGDVSYHYSFPLARGEADSLNDDEDAFTVFYKEDGTKLWNTRLTLIPYDITEHMQLTSYYTTT